MEVRTAEAEPKEEIREHAPRLPSFARMPPRARPGRRLAAAAFLPIGVGLTSWNYLWRTTPLHRRELAGSADEHGPPALPSDAPDDDVQTTEDGVGPLFHRIYRVRIVEPELGADELIARIQADPNRVTPREFATFRKASGDEGGLAVGDEFVVRMPGPWDGPVRTVDTTATSFRFATLTGHLEAGQIEFRARDEPDRALAFEIEAWARSGDRFSNLLFQHLRMAKEIQLHMWTSVLERAVRLAGGRMPDGVEIETYRVEADAFAR